MFDALQLLHKKGVRYSTVIDIGCADGQFFLGLCEKGIAADAVPLNIDANSLYRKSLEEIQKVVGGHFRICAVTDRQGETGFTMSAHPYWASVRPQDDPYWDRVNKLSTTTTTIAATTLDALAGELALKAPFLLKLDVQGAEVDALRGASAVLKQTSVVICEADVDDFQNINSTLVDNGFVLYDVTQIGRLSDGTLGWFYPVYIHRDLESVRPRGVWEASENANMIRLHEERRNVVLRYNLDMLNRIRSAQKLSAGASRAQGPLPVLTRNQECPCGSGRKYKHCCGANS